MTAIASVPAVSSDPSEITGTPAARTGGEMIVDAMIASGVRHAFGIAGVHNLPLYDALYDRGKITTFVTRHEQGAAFMADGYARIAGTPGVALVTTGPGLTNTVTPIAGSWSDGIPVLVIGTAGEVPLLGKYKGYLHEYKDQHGVMDAAAGSRLVTRTDDLETATIELLAGMQTGRARPAVLEVPIDTMAASATTRPQAAPARPQVPVPNAEAVRRTALMLRQATRPLIFAGGGVVASGAHVLLLRLAELLRAPVLTSISGKGAIPDSSPWAAGCTWRTSSGPADGYPDEWRLADAGIVVGSRLTGMSTRAWRLPLPPRLAHLDIDASEIGKSYAVEEPLVGDARAGLEMLLAELEHLGGDGASVWKSEQIKAIRDADDRAGEERCADALTVVRQVREGLPEDGILACDQSIACYWSVRHFRVEAPRRFLYPAGSAALGFGLPVGIGRRRVPVHGDRACDSSAVRLAGDHRRLQRQCVRDDQGFAGASLWRTGHRHCFAEPGLRSVWAIIWGARGEVARAGRDR
ncbi:MAG: thiamine pyrophosphate-binding protein [Proteobacteria bacterium]|nr:thiamine pyrophosphate-binding protein [Pseudomonadota bacterium]